MATNILPANLAAKARDIRHQLEKLDSAIQFLRMDDPRLIDAAKTDALEALREVTRISLDGSVDVMMAMTTRRRRAS